MSAAGGGGCVLWQWRCGSDEHDNEDNDGNAQVNHEYETESI